jgi:serine/threonine-protein kinase RsbW
MAIVHRSRNRDAMAASELTVVLPLEKRDVGTLRRSLHALFASHAVPRAIADDIVLSTQEACNNVIVHGGDADGDIHVTASCEDHRVYVEVRDHGRGFDLHCVRPDHAPDPLRTNGRGLFLIHRLMDDVEVCTGSGGTVVRMWKGTRTAAQRRRRAEG